MRSPPLRRRHAHLSAPLTRIRSRLTRALSSPRRVASAARRQRRAPRRPLSLPMSRSRPNRPSRRTR
eukprot:6582221-Prymnesium_polylepis.1